MQNPFLTLCVLALLTSFSGVDAIAQPKVLTTIKPLQLIAAAITSGVTQPDVLIPATQSPHNFTLRPSDVRKISEADVIVWIGPQMETYFVSVFSQQRQATIVQAVALDGVELLEAHEGEEHAQETGTGSFRYDPHLWLDTGNAILIAANLASSLASLDAPNAKTYQMNLQKFRDSIAALDLDVASDLSAIKDKRYVVYHNGIQYFENQFGLRHEFVIVPDHEIQPGIKHILAIRKQLNATEPVCVLEDVSSNAATIDTVFRYYPVTRARIDVLGEHISLSSNGYTQLINALTVSLSQCLGR